MATKSAVGARRFVPEASSIKELRDAALGCRGCELYKSATQTVFGAGPETARVVMIGEQPGDVEDQVGEPFAGPAGRVLDQAIADVGLDRADIYVTNAVKHFKFKSAERGRRRIHQPPNRGEVVACMPWLVAELSVLRPEVLIALGAVAAKALLGPSFRVSAERGRLLPWPESAQYPQQFPSGPAQIIATIHPSAVLRAENRAAAYDGFLADLRTAAEVLTAGTAA